MSSFPNSPKLIRGGLIVVDPRSRRSQRVIALQYNPDSLTRSFQVQATGQDGDRTEALRIKAPPIETIRIEAEIDAADQLENANPTAVEVGLQSYLAALELLLYPASGQLRNNRQASQRGELEIVPMEAPLTLFVWSRQRVLPVKITELSITEEAFDPDLNPIRARISLGMRVMSVNDFGFDHYGGDVYLAYQQAKERLAAHEGAGSLDRVGLQGLP